MATIEEKHPEASIELDSSFDILKNSPNYEKLMSQIKVLTPAQQKAALDFALACHKKALKFKNSSGKNTFTQVGDDQVITTATGSTFTTTNVDGNFAPKPAPEGDIVILETKDIVDVEILDAIIVGQIEKLHSLLVRFNKTVVSEVCAKNETVPHPVIHWAALEDRVEILQYIQSNLPANKSIDVKNARGESALHWACLRGHVRSVNFLLRNGADVALTDSRGYSALHHAAQFGHTNVIAQLLRFMARRNLSNIDMRDNGGRTALHWASYKHFPSTVRFLINKGADLFSRDFEDLSPLHWAALQGDVDVVQTLLWEVKTPAKMLKLLEGVDKNGQNPFQMADAKGEKFHEKSAEGYRFKHVKHALQTAHNVASRNKLPTRGFAGAASGQNAVYDESFYHPIYLSWPLIGVVLGYVYFFTMVPHLYIYTPSLIIMSTIIFIATWATFLRIQVQDPGFIVCSAVDAVSKQKRFFNYLLPCWPARGYVAKSEVSRNVGETAHLMEGGRSFDQQYEELFPPSSVPNPNIKLSSYYRELYYEILDKGLTAPICTTCEIAKPLRSKHDRFSDKCIVKFDHYCPWVGSPVAKGNYIDFFFFCLTVTILVPYWVANWYYYLKYFDESQTILQNAARIEMVPWIVFTLLPVIPFIAYAGVMVASHAWLISFNMTTNESINKFRYQYFDTVGGKQVSKFSQGFVKNWLEFLGLVEPKTINFRQFYQNEFQGAKDATSRIAEAQRAMQMSQAQWKVPTLSNVSITTNPNLTASDVVQDLSKLS